MKDINELRKEIDEIDKEMKKLFIQRMNVAYGIAEYKKENNLPVYDPSREQQIIDRIRNDKEIDEKLKPYYIEFITSLMNISKDYQKNSK